MRPRTGLWEAIHHYVLSCGGDPGITYGNTARERAVVEVEKAVDQELAECREALAMVAKAAVVVLAEHANPRMSRQQAREAFEKALAEVDV